MGPPEDDNITQLQGQISTLTKMIQVLTLLKVGRLQFWCIEYYTEGHVATKCPSLRGACPSSTLMAHLLVGLSGGVVQVVVVALFHRSVQYHAFPNTLGVKNN